MFSSNEVNKNTNPTRDIGGMKPGQSPGNIHPFIPITKTWAHKIIRPSRINPID